MKLYTSEKSVSSEKKIVLDDMMLTKDMPTAAGSKMLSGYMSLFSADVCDKLAVAGYAVCGKANVGEFAIDLLGETSFYGACTDENGSLGLAAAEIVKKGDVNAAVVLEVNGSNARAAALSGLAFVKPTYGTVSRFGTVPVACSGETVSVVSKTVGEAKNVLSAIAGHDEKDGTSLSAEECISVAKDSAPAKKVAVIGAMTEKLEASEAEKINSAVAALEKSGAAVTVIDGSELLAAKTAWNVLMCAELCNNVSRYDGIKYGYRTPNYRTIDELYTNSRTEAFGELLKTAILYGSDCLSTENYMKVYDKALRIRRVISEYFGKLFAEYDAIMMPVCSKSCYTEEDVKADRYISFEENVYTAPAMITGLPAVVAGGVQLVGKAFSDGTLLATAKLLEKEGK